MDAPSLLRPNLTMLAALMLGFAGSSALLETTTASSLNLSVAFFPFIMLHIHEQTWDRPASRTTLIIATLLMTITGAFAIVKLLELRARFSSMP